MYVSPIHALRRKKLIPLEILVTILGVVQLARGKASGSLKGPLFAGSSTSPSSYSLALYSGLWAFDGWDQANFVGGEITQPEKNIPRAIHSSMIVVTVRSFDFIVSNVLIHSAWAASVSFGQCIIFCRSGKSAYLLKAFAQLFAFLFQNIVGMSNTVAMDFGRALFGPIGGSVFAFMVAFSCFGALNGILRTTISHCPTKLLVLGSFFTSSRLVYAASRERYLPTIFGKLHSTRRTPLNAALLQAAITIAFIMIGSGFRSLINFSVVASWAFYFLTVSLN